MATAGFSISAKGAAQFIALSKELRKAGRGDLRKALQVRITAAGKPVVADVRSVVTSLQVKSSHGGGGGQRRAHAVGRTSTERAKASAARRKTGLRRTIAGATKLEITARGVRIIVRKDALPPSQQSLPRHLDSVQGWRHPVFGNREAWVTQRGATWFASTIQRHAPEFRRAVLTAVDDIQRRIEKGS
jgi:hypothetical protein